MARQFNVYGGTVFPSDSANTALACVERDTNGDTFQSGVNASTYAKILGALYLKGGTTLTTTATLDTTQTMVRADATSAGFTITLPPAAGSTNQLYVIWKIDSVAHTVTVKGNGSENINGANTDTTLSSQYNVIRIWCDGTQWWKF